MNDEHDMNTAQNSPAGIRRAVSDSVLRRRKYHIAITEWEARWLPWLQAAGALVGFVIVLLPAMSRGWRSVIQDISVANWFFEEFSRFGPFALATLVLLLSMTSALYSLHRHFPGDWDVRKEHGFPSATVMRDRTLYPQTLKEEVTFWLLALLGIFGFFIWLYIPFGLISFFIRIGEV